MLKIEFFRVDYWVLFHLKLIKKIYNKIFYYLEYYIDLVRFGAEVPEYWVDVDNRIVYVVNAKAACTSIKNALYFFSEGVVAEVNVHTDSGADKYKSHSLEGIDLDGYFVFSFVRHPVERIISCYRNKFTDFKNGKDKGFLYENYLGGYLRVTDTFLDFVGKILIIPWKYCDRHFVSQYYWIYKRCKVAPDYIGKIENIQSDWAVIQSKFPGMPSLGHQNSSSVTDIELSCDCRKSLESKYKKDIDFFDYS